jgi:hypothetical protein
VKIISFTCTLANKCLKLSKYLINSQIIVVKLADEQLSNLSRKPCGAQDAVRKFQRGHTVRLNDVDGTIFVKVLDVWSGRKECQEMSMGELPLLVNVADR